MAKSRSKRTLAKPKPIHAFRRRAPAATAEAIFPQAAPVDAVVAERSAVPESTAPRPAPTEAAIRALAYERYLGRDGAPGRRIDDWLEAERQLRAG